MDPDASDPDPGMTAVPDDDIGTEPDVVFDTPVGTSEPDTVPNTSSKPDGTPDNTPDSTPSSPVDVSAPTGLHEKPHTAPNSSVSMLTVCMAKFKPEGQCLGLPHESAHQCCVYRCNHSRDRDTTNYFNSTKHVSNTH